MDLKMEFMPFASAPGTHESNVRPTATTAPSVTAITMFLVAESIIYFQEPWCDFVPGQADAFLRELKNELAPDHPLYSVELHPLGHSGPSDDAIFKADDGRIFQVHLTWTGKTEKAPWPRSRTFASTAEWVETMMRPANEDWRG
jgi:hypothetical protein